MPLTYCNNIYIFNIDEATEEAKRIQKEWKLFGFLNTDEGKKLHEEYALYCDIIFEYSFHVQ